MTIGPFPSSIPIGPVPIPLHLIFESLAYFVGFRLYLHQRRRSGDFLSSPDRWWIVTAAIAGAAIGSKIGAWMEDPAATLRHWNDPFFLFGGKTIVGGLLGGTIAVEWIKRRLGIVCRTGDLFAIPLAVAIAIGRIGCFFGGLPDNTFGIPVALPWAVDFGDGIPRHPTQLYEMAAMLMLAWALSRMRRQARPQGDLFRAFLLAYLAWRLAIEFLKPAPRLAGLDSIQWICIAALLFYHRDLIRLLVPRRIPAHG